jgi:hypothetical protein
VGRQTGRQQSSFKQVMHRDAKAPKNTKLDFNQNTDSGTFSMPNLFISLYLI